MIEFENRIRIERPREEVFDFVSNFENVPKWNYFVESVRKVDQIPIGIGGSLSPDPQNGPATFRDYRV